LTLRRYLLALSVSFATGPLAAQPDMETMLVTGSRTPLDINRLGASASVISREQIEARGSGFVSDLLREMPGLAVSRAGTFGAQTQVRVRGAEGNHVMVLIDGIEANDPGGNDEFDFGQLLTGDIERIEIVRGPQSSLWGSDALAGVINIVTRKGGNGTRASFGFEEGSFATSQQRANFAFGDDTRRFYAGVNRLDSGGVNISRNGDEDDAFHNLSVDLNGAIKPTDDLQLSFVLRTVNSTGQADESPAGIYEDAPSEGNFDQTIAALRAKLGLFDQRWLNEIAASWSSTERDFADSWSWTAAASDRYKLTCQSTLLLPEEMDWLSNQSLTVAVDHEYQRFVQRGVATAWGDPNQRRGMHSTGVVAEYHADLLQSFSLSASVRRDLNSDFKDVTTYRTAVSALVPRTQTRLHAAYATGQKAPTFIERFGYSSGGPTVFIGNPGLEPERSRGWEVGVAQSLWSERASLSLTWFQENLRDEINGYVFSVDFSSATALNLDGTSHRRGLEFEGTLELPWSVRFRGYYTYLDADERDAGTGARVDEIRRPEHAGGAALHWQSENKRLQLHAYVDVTGEQQDIAFVPPTYNQRVTLSAYTLLGVHVSYAIVPGVEIYTRGENLLDDDYEEIFSAQSPGAAVYAGLRIAFDSL